MKTFDITLQETKAAFSYNLNKMIQKTYAKLADVNTDCICGMPVKVDIHGLSWFDRTILEVKTIDYDTKQAVVKNRNGLEWVTKLSSIQFCDENGLRL